MIIIMYCYYNDAFYPTTNGFIKCTVYTVPETSKRTILKYALDSGHSVRILLDSATQPVRTLYVWIYIILSYTLVVTLQINNVI